MRWLCIFIFSKKNAYASCRTFIRLPTVSHSNGVLAKPCPPKTFQVFRPGPSKSPVQDLPSFPSRTFQVSRSRPSKFPVQDLPSFQNLEGLKERYYAVFYIFTTRAVHTPPSFSNCRKYTPACQSRISICCVINAASMVRTNWPVGAKMRSRSNETED